MKMKGVYILLIWLPRTRKIKIGRLGNLSFKRGIYLYVGSAISGIEATLVEATL